MDVQEDENDNNNQTTSASPKMHSCDVRVTFPTNRQAQYALQVLQVDKEPTDRVTKSMEVEMSDGIKEKSTDSTETYDGEEERIAVLKVHFESSELKMLRVSVSSFYDYLALVVKTFQEFDR
mmetsp:Transcript_55785/g.135180  ORF Transcript_55785/g.135180 Transcript_55785/m.135180 type:complete len:122 (-) Transcript_55785:191-556(-)|eukprot:CAMPEP_0113471288 /NCGR_PEP_ID=MMETSP0014_2-20120614/16899_1 /TAXON_ID=2857 /ORGANISM="Nitzschia sp." /LENGTH=121 /DNA_ID=CAMNT_0000363915 /DNA_START=1082 /DNA_END=1447 /DNA_ORIENTATION=- /assembly_acc=CAM_ASM_000159